ncbi:MAG: hypothetical protein FWE38_05040 [Firmicutes bacterium]|nr:hypothetical protein [Bacillota bacterium]
MTIEPYNPALHGGVSESYMNINRNGLIFTVIGILFIAAAIVVLNIFGFGYSGVPLTNLLFWLLLGFGILLTIIGAVNIAEANRHRALVRELKAGGYVTRGSIHRVAHTYRLFGKTRQTSSGDLMARDTGWFYKVTYAFQDQNEKIRKATGIIPDPIGPKRGTNPNQQTFLDFHRPRIGLRVDVLFNDDGSLILRIIEAS